MEDSQEEKAESEWKSDGEAKDFIRVEKKVI